MKEEYNFKQIIPEKIGYSRVGEFDVHILKKNITFGVGFKKLLNKRYIEIFEDENKKVMMIRASDNKATSWAIYSNKTTIRTSMPARWITSKKNYGFYEGKIVGNEIIVDLKKGERV